MEQTGRKAFGDVFDRTIRSMDGLPDVITTKAHDGALIIGAAGINGKSAGHTLYKLGNLRDCDFVPLHLKINA